MSRSGYIDDMDDVLALGRWRAQVSSSIRGKRGQAFLRDLVEALDAMDEKRLIAHDLENEGNVCAIGSVGVRRGIDMSALDPEDSERVAGVFNIADPLAREIVFMNDEAYFGTSPERRWQFMRDWAFNNLKDKSGLSRESSK